MKLGIDVQTKDVQRLVLKLARLTTTTGVHDGGRYSEDRSFSQVHLETSWTESELDAWLYEFCTSIGWVGCWSMEQKVAA